MISDTNTRCPPSDFRARSEELGAFLVSYFRVSYARHPSDLRARSEEALSARLRECVDDMAGVVDDIVSLRTSHRETTTTLLLPSSYGRYAYTVMPSPHVPQGYRGRMVQGSPHVPQGYRGRMVQGSPHVPQ
eukprot:1185684-Prorocentrum_minimum.AAC.1